MKHYPTSVSSFGKVVLLTVALSSLSCSARPNGPKLTLPQFKGPIHAEMSWQEVSRLRPDGSELPDGPFYQSVSQDTARHTIELSEPFEHGVLWNCNIEVTFVRDSLVMLRFYNEGNWSRDDIWKWFDQSVKSLPASTTAHTEETDKSGWTIETWSCAGAKWVRTWVDVEETGDFMVTLQVFFR